jgi:hypothetical protein
LGEKKGAEPFQNGPHDKWKTIDPVKNGLDKENSAITNQST